MRRHILNLGLATILAGWATAANALTIYTTPVASDCTGAGCMPPAAVLNTLQSYSIVDFEEADLGAQPSPLALPYVEGPATYSGDGAIWQNPMPNMAAPPAGDTSKYLTVPFPEQDGNLSGTVTITLGQTFDVYGLYWGSMDNYNTLAFYLGGNLVADFIGNEISPGDGNQIEDDTNFYVTFVGLPYDEVRLSSSQFAFESDNHLFGVPEPAPLALLGLGLLGLAARRFRKA